MHSAWGPYPDTVLVFPGAGIQLDLRYPLVSSVRQALLDQGLGGPFAVKDAHPGARPAHGRSPDGSHVEPGWALALPLEAARSLAARFFQNALFWFDGDRFHIVPVLAPGPAVPLPPRPASP